MTQEHDAASTQKPTMPAYDRHIFVCVGDKCSPAEGHAVYEHLKQALKEGASDPALRRVKRSKSTCLGVCQGGPVSVVYPDGVWYCRMTKEKMDRVVQDHLKQGRPVKDFAFYPPSIAV